MRTVLVLIASLFFIVPCAQAQSAPSIWLGGLGVASTPLNGSEYFSVVQGSSASQSCLGPTPPAGCAVAIASIFSLKSYILASLTSNITMNPYSVLCNPMSTPILGQSCTTLPIGLTIPGATITGLVLNSANATYGEQFIGAYSIAVLDTTLSTGLYALRLKETQNICFNGNEGCMAESGGAWFMGMGFSQGLSLGTDNTFAVLSGKLVVPSMPTSCSGHPAGTFVNIGHIVEVC